MKRTLSPKGCACRLSILLALCAPAAALFSQEPAPQPGIWPRQGSGQWVWVAPRTDLAEPEIDAVFKRAIGEGTAFVATRDDGAVFFPQKFRPTEGSAKKRKQYRDLPGKADDLRITSEWQSGFQNQNRGQTYTFIPLDGVRGVDLHYLPRMRERFPKAPEGRNWVVNVFADTLYSFFFRLEDTARAFVNALASTLERRELKLSFSRSGLMWENINQAQAIDMDPVGAGRDGPTLPEGVLVTMVAAGGPADHAGVRPLDVVIEINGEKVRNFSHLTLLLDKLAPGAGARLSLLRRLKPPDLHPGPCPWEPLSVVMEAR